MRTLAIIFLAVGSAAQAALPVILVNSSSGSDSAASGAGPATALTGSAAATDGTGLVVTLDGSPDLTGVATDGSHVIYLSDATAGARNFGKITAKDDTAKTVTVSDAFATGLSGKTWAIGGKRASIGSSSSVKLLENNNTSGDAMPGWTVELESGHSETISDLIEWKRGGTYNGGPITLRAASGAATRPVLTWSNNGTAIDLWNTDFKVVQGIDFKNSNATKTASVAIKDQGSVSSVVREVRISDSANKFWKAVEWRCISIIDSEIAYTAGRGIVIEDYANNPGAPTIRNCYIHDCGSDGIYGATKSNRTVITDNIIESNAGYGLYFANLPSQHTLSRNTVYGNSSGGFYLDESTMKSQLSIENNIFASNGGYGINGASGTLLMWQSAVMRGNDFHNNTSGKYTPDLSTVSLNEQTSDPQFTNAAGGDFSIGTNLKATGFPAGAKVGVWSATDSFVDPGAAQREEPTGGGSGGNARLIGGGLVRT